MSHCIGSKVVDLPLSRHSRDREEARWQYKVDGHQCINWMGRTATRGKVKANKWIPILSSWTRKEKLGQPFVIAIKFKETNIRSYYHNRTFEVGQKEESLFHDSIP